MMCLNLFLTFFEIGLFTFGGGYAMLPLIQEEVLNHGWLGLSELIDFVAISESTPGPFAINISTYVGAEVQGILGSACATLGVVLPSFIVILIVAKFFERFKNSKIVKGCMTGLRPAVIGLIATAALTMAKTVFFENGEYLSKLTSPEFYISFLTFAVMTVLAFKKKHPILIICLSAVIGIASGYIIF